MIEVNWNVFVSEDELPLKESIIVKWENDEITIDTFNSHDVYGIVIESSIGNIPLNTMIGIKAWSTIEEKPKEKGSRVYLDFSESELEELQGLLSLSQNYLDVTDLRDWKHKEEIIKKFQDKFSKVEF